MLNSDTRNQTILIALLETIVGTLCFILGVAFGCGLL